MDSLSEQGNLSELNKERLKLRLAEMLEAEVLKMKKLLKIIVLVILMDIYFIVLAEY